MIIIQKQIFILIWGIIWVFLEYRNFLDKLTWIIPTIILWTMRIITTTCTLYYIITSFMLLLDWLTKHVKFV